MRIYRRNGFWLAIVCAATLLAAGCASTGPVGRENENNALGTSESVQAETGPYQANETKSPSAGPLWLQSARRDGAEWPDRIIEDSKRTFLKRDNMAALLLAGGASIAMHQDADKEIADHFERHPHLHNFRDESLYVAGHPGTHFAGAGIWYALSAENKNELNRQRAWTMMTALAVNSLTTTGLKAIRDNDTPNGKQWAWPSGHTSSSFTVASVLDEYYGPKVGIPAYVLASLVGYRMMDTGDHWASDVVFGATLGWVVGHTVAGSHKKLEVAGFEVSPYLGNAGAATMGVSLVKQF